MKILPRNKMRHILFFFICAVVLAVLVYFLVRKDKETYEIQPVTNPPKGYWYWRKDSGGQQVHDKDGMYLHQVVFPPAPVSNDCSACPADTQCYENGCVPYTNAEIYNNPCCSPARLMEACEKWTTENNLEWLWAYCDQHKDDTLCQMITRSKVQREKVLLCQLFQSVCTGSLTDHVPKEYENHCRLEETPIPLIMDADPFNAIRELFFNCPYLYSKFRAKIRVTNLEGGSRGWGFWNTTMSPAQMGMIWFMHQNGICPSDKQNAMCPAGQPYPLNGMYAMIVSPGDKTKMIKLEDLDENWHEYEIDWKKDGVTFSVDGKIVYTENDSIPSCHMAFHCWVDNAVFAPGHVVQNMTAPRSQDIQYLQIWL